MDNGSARRSWHFAGLARGDCGVSPPDFGDVRGMQSSRPGKGKGMPMGRDPGHRPVLLEEVIDLLEPAGRKLMVDCTLGLGGHARALLAEAGEQGTLLGIDVDRDNLTNARRRLADWADRVRFFEANFAHISEVLDQAGLGPADLVLADLGVCSAQLDDPGRGLSFQQSGPLDMRLDPSLEKTAADLVAELTAEPLADLIYEYGQERYSRRIARAIVAQRSREPIETTDRLAQIVRKAVPPPARKSRRGVDPATRTFQALRIAVNDEMGSLDRLLADLPHCLAEGARVGIISFHSLEDGRVKRAFARLEQAGAGKRITRKPVTASESERQANPRSRSAKLRVFEASTRSQ
jgi:16S rRNA (cytosine1402-N4)-methyltransferase